VRALLCLAVDWARRLDDAIGDPAGRAHGRAHHRHGRVPLLFAGLVWQVEQLVPAPLITDGFAPEITDEFKHGHHGEASEKTAHVDSGSPSTAGGEQPAYAVSLDAEKAQLPYNHHLDPANNNSGNNNIPLQPIGSSATKSTGVTAQQPVCGNAKDEQEEEETFMHPSLLEEQKPIWLPDDKFGIGRAGVAAARQRGVEATVERTTVNEKGVVTTDADVPPGEVVE